MLHALLSDSRYALRWLARSPAFTLVAVLSLAIGTGFNSALFSIVDALLFRPLPVERPDRLVDVYTSGDGDGEAYATSSYADYVDFRDRNSVFAGVLAFSPSISAVRAGEQSRMALGEVVSGNYFQVLGVKAVVGRTLLPEDDRPGAPRAVMLSHALWTRDYAADPAALGRTVHIHGQPYIVVGVAPQSFTGMVPMLQPELWTPLARVEEVEPAGIQHVVPSPGNTRLERRGQRWLFVKGRLKDGETLARAKANLDVIMRQLAVAYPQSNGKQAIAVAANVRVHPQADAMLKPVAAGLMIALGLVLLVACANVANMLLARGSGRRKEIGIRLAIGAGRGRLIRQLLTESLILSLLGALAGLGLAALLLRIANAVPVPIAIPLALGLRIDGRVLLFTTVVATLAGIVAGVAPALRATRPNLASDMKGDAPIASAAGRRWTLRDGLVALQAAVTLVLLVCAGLLTRSILEARNVDLGFRAEGLVAVSTELGLVGYDDARASQFFERALERVRALPGVTAASRSVRQPLAVNYNYNMVFFAERQQADGKGLAVAATWVDGNYFATLSVPLLRGRNFTTADVAAAPRVVIVNEAFARTYWPGSDPIGRKFRVRAVDGPEYEVVGIAADYKVQTVGEKPTPYIHYALSQRTFTGEVLIVRSAVDATALVGAIRREILSMERNAVFLDSATMESLVDVTLLPATLAARTIGAVGLIATALAAVGLYGVIAYTVARRGREIGVRMALGATPAAVKRMIMRQGLTVTGAGLLVGIALSWLAARAIASTLYGVGALDPAAWAGAVVVLLGAAALANYIPARRAARMEPSIALRLE
jgi:predicted permease